MSRYLSTMEKIIEENARLRLRAKITRIATATARAAEDDARMSVGFGEALELTKRAVK